MHYLFIFLSVLIANPTSWAEVYTWTDENGNRHYGDEAPAHASKAQLPAIHKLKDISAPKKLEESTTTTEAQDNVFAGYSKLEIINPKEEQMITMGEAGQVQVDINIYPPLQPNHQLVVLLDGKVINQNAQVSLSLENLDRGSHLLQAQIKQHGKTLLSSPKRRIHVQRPSILNRPRT